MSCEEDAPSTHIEEVDVNAENGSNSEKSSDSGVETVDACSETYPASFDSEKLSSKVNSTDEMDRKVVVPHNEESIEDSSSSNSLPSSPVSTSPDDSPAAESLSYDDTSPSKNNTSAKDTLELTQADIPVIPLSNVYVDSFKMNNNLATSSISLYEQNSSQIMPKAQHSRSAENISVNNVNMNDSSLDRVQILSQFTTQKSKVTAVHKIPGNTNVTTSNPNQVVDSRYPRIPKEILSQDIGNIVKNVHGIFSSVSGSLKYAYNQRSTQKPVKSLKPVPNGKVMNDIFEDDSTETTPDERTQISPEILCNKVEIPIALENQEMLHETSEEADAKIDVRKLQVETLERLLSDQRKENAMLRDRVKQQADDLQEKDQTFRELEVKLDMMGKRVEEALREKDAAVMRYASVECAGIEARRAADLAAKTERAALAEVDLLNNKMRAAQAERQRIIQLYDDKCHELQNTERELSKVREDMKELEGRLKWTQSKLRMEMDAYKDSSERVEKLTQQVSELEAAKETAAVNATDSVKAKQLECELEECRAALILCRHDKGELERRLSSTSAVLDACKRERDDACASLVETTMEVEKLKISNLRLEEEAAELAALRAKAALADTLSAQLQRESERAAQAEEALSSARAVAETCARREAAALSHAASLTQQHVATRHVAQRHEDKAQALSADNASLREQVSSLEEQRTKLQASLSEEVDRRNKENRVLARKVAELTEEVAEVNKKLEWEKGENGVLKKKHTSAIKELNRELQRAVKRCEQLEAKLPPPDEHSTRTGSVTSLSSGESAPTDDRLHNGHTDGLPDIQVREPDRQTLIERIVSLQRAAARRAERCEFLEEHSKQLTEELRKKSRLLRHMLSSMPAGAVASEDRDNNKKEIARLGGGAMAAVWGGDPNGMSLELSLEMNKRLQAVLEDTILKNITLKENMDTLGAEISRLRDRRDTK